jgi:hypothetical protein
MSLDTKVSVSGGGELYAKTSGPGVNDYLDAFGEQIYSRKMTLTKDEQKLETEFKLSNNSESVASGIDLDLKYPTGYERVVKPDNLYMLDQYHVNKYSIAMKRNKILTHLVSITSDDISQMTGKFSIDHKKQQVTTKFAVNANNSKLFELIGELNPKPKNSIAETRVAGNFTFSSGMTDDRVWTRDFDLDILMEELNAVVLKGEKPPT